MIGKLSFILAFVLASSCAQPRYEKVDSLKPQSDGLGTAIQKASDCSLKFQNSLYCISWTWETQPTSKEVGALVFKIFRGNVFDDSPVLVDLALLPKLILWMPSMGHGSSPTSIARIDVGTYRATNVFFIMPGDWELRFLIMDGTTILDKAFAQITR